MGKNDFEGFCWLVGPTEPWKLSWLVTVRGSEFFQLYLWILKDLAWTQDWYYVGHTFGALAVIWSCYLVINTILLRNWNEFFVGTAQLMWLSANFWWMTGELHDFEFPKSPEWISERQVQAGHTMIAAMCWLCLYYLVIRGFKLFTPQKEALLVYDETGITEIKQWKYMTWREYENIHILFWLGKDIAWNFTIPSMWFIFSIPTFVIAADFVRVTAMTKHLFVDHMHAFAQWMWVFANLVWAVEDLFYPPPNLIPYTLDSTSPKARRSGRWYSSWFLITAYGFITILYLVWWPLTITGKLTEDGEIHKHQQLHYHDHDHHHHTHHQEGVLDIDTNISDDEIEMGKINKSSQNNVDGLAVSHTSEIESESDSMAGGRDNNHAHRSGGKHSDHSPTETASLSSPRAADGSLSSPRAIVDDINTSTANVNHILTLRPPHARLPLRPGKTAWKTLGLDELVGDRKQQHHNDDVDNEVDLEERGERHGSPPVDNPLWDEDSHVL